ncbi:MAG: hypothetical protein ACKVOE_09580 [Rickettsiales bacterium]
MTTHVSTPSTPADPTGANAPAAGAADADAARKKQEAAARAQAEAEEAANALATREAEAKAAAEAEAKAKAAATPTLGARLQRGAKYTTGFVNGTFENGFGSMGKWGRKGMWVGGGVGILLAISGMGLIMPFMGMAAGLFAGAVAGGTFGVLTGGIRQVNRIKRVEDNTDQVQARANSAQLRQSAVTRGPDYRQKFNNQQLQQNYTIDRVIQSERENRQDSFVDRLNAEGRYTSRGF